jgi:hypothetical protein
MFNNSLSQALEVLVSLFPPLQISFMSATSLRRWIIHSLYLPFNSVDHVSKLHHLLLWDNFRLRNAAVTATHFKAVDLILRSVETVSENNVSWGIQKVISWKNVVVYISEVSSFGNFYFVKVLTSGTFKKTWTFMCIAVFWDVAP